jgi:hypothetical protein
MKILLIGKGCGKYDLNSRTHTLKNGLKFHFKPITYKDSAEYRTFKRYIAGILRESCLKRNMVVQHLFSTGMKVFAL